MTKHVPLFLPLGSIRLLTIFFSFCIIFVHPALADKMAESPELFDTAFTLQERLDIPDGFVQREMVYISILLGTLVLCLFFFFMQRRMKKLRERDRERYLQLLEGILDNLPIAAKVKDVNDGMRYTFWNKKAEELFECSAREAIGKTDFETMPEAAALIRKEDEELVKTGIPQEGIRRFFTKKNYNPQIQISAESETKRSIFREKDKTKRSKKESAQHSKSRNKSFVMTSVSAL